MHLNIASEQMIWITASDKPCIVNQKQKKMNGMEEQEGKAEEAAAAADN